MSTDGNTVLTRTTPLQDGVGCSQRLGKSVIRSLGAIVHRFPFWHVSNPGDTWTSWHREDGARLAVPTLLQTPWLDEMSIPEFLHFPGPSNTSWMYHHLTNLPL